MNQIQPDQLGIVIHWIKEREMARLNKEAGLPKPWTDDPIIQNYRFCNVNRCDDRETKGIFALLEGAHWINMVVARFINKTSTLEALGMPWIRWNEAGFLAQLDDMQRRGLTIYNGAYMIRGGTGEDAKVPKHHYLARRIFTPMWENRRSCPGDGASLYDWAVWFQQFFGMGDFMTNQIITDMKYLAPGLMDAPGWDTFLLPGPGTMRGINRVYGRPKEFHQPAHAFVREAQEIRQKLLYHLPHMDGTFLDLNNVSNTMCEFDKYSRVFFQEPGRPKQRYKGVR